MLRCCRVLWLLLQEYIIRGGRDKFSALPKAFQVSHTAAAAGAAAAAAAAAGTKGRTTAAEGQQAVTCQVIRQWWQHQR
jgi:hypothetical protein